MLVVKVVHLQLADAALFKCRSHRPSQELAVAAPVAGGKPTLFLGNSDFITWELAGVPVEAPMIGIPQAPLNPAKPWVYGQAMDIDSVEAM